LKNIYVINLKKTFERYSKRNFTSKQIGREDKLYLIGKAREDFTQFLIKNIDVFVWSALDILDINRQIIEHKLYIKPGYKPVRQQKRSVRIERQRAIRAEVEKLLKTGFIQEVTCLSWLSNSDNERIGSSRPLDVFLWIRKR
jgi:hypothetical protein